MRDAYLGCAGLVALIAVAAGLFLIGGASLARSLADWRVSANGATVAIQETEQTQIEWDARTEIERIRADVTKKTDVTFILFWLVRALLWGVCFIVALAGGALLWQGGRRG